VLLENEKNVLIVFGFMLLMLPLMSNFSLGYYELSNVSSIYKGNGISLLGSAIDSSGYTHSLILSNNIIYHCDNSLGSWNCGVVQNTGINGEHRIGRFGKISIDNNDYIHIVHSEQDPESSRYWLWYCNNTLGNWTCEYIDEAGTPSYIQVDDLHLAVDSNDFVHIVARDDYSGDKLIYCNNTLGNWTCSYLGSAWNGYSPYIIIDDNDKPNIFSDDVDDDKIYHYYIDDISGNWTYEVVSTNENANTIRMDRISVKIDTNGYYHLSYRDLKYTTVYDSDLFYCNNTLGSWTCVELDNQSYDLGDHTNIGIDNNNFIHIIHTRENPKEIRYCNNFNGWNCYTLLSGTFTIPEKNQALLMTKGVQIGKPSSFIKPHIVFLNTTDTRESFDSILNDVISIDIVSPTDLVQTINPQITFKVQDSSPSYNCYLYVDDNLTQSIIANNNTETTISPYLTNGDHTYYFICNNSLGEVKSETRTIGVGSHFSRCAIFLSEDQNAKFYLDSDISSSGSNCLIFSRNIDQDWKQEIDCQNHKITVGSSDSAIVINGGANNRGNINITNCEISGGASLFNKLIDLKDVSNIIFDNITLYSSNSNKGIYASGYSNIYIINSKILSSSNSQGSVYLWNVRNPQIINNTFTSSGYGKSLILYDDYTRNGIITGNTFTGNYGINIEYDARDNNIYNNHFINCGIGFSSMSNWYPNYYNTSLQSGTPIYTNGNLIGGNYWGKSDGTGYSDTCVDSDYNGICDSPKILGTNQVDYLPLTNIPYILDVTSPEQNKVYSVGYVSIGGTSTLNGDLIYSLDGGSNQTLCTDCNSFSTSVYSDKGTHEVCIYGYESDDTNNNDYECITYYSKNTLLQEQPIALVLIFLVIMGTVLFIGRNLLFKSFDTKYMPLIIMGIIVISILLVSIFLVYVNTPIF